MSIGLKLYLANAKRAGQHSLRLQKHATSTDDNETRLARPAGQLLWLHAGTKCQFTAITELIRQLSGEHTQLSFLVTTPKNTPTDIRFQESCKQPCLQIIVPDDTPQQVDKFLNHWQPAMGIWLGPVLRPALVVGSRKKQIGLYMVNANSRASIETSRVTAKELQRIFCAGLIISTPQMALFRVIWSSKARGPDRLLWRACCKRASIRYIAMTGIAMKWRI